MKATETISLSDWLRSAAAALSGKTDMPQLEARLMLSSLLGCSNAWLLAHDSEKLTSGQLSDLENLLIARIRGFPLPYLLGEWPFFGRDFEVSPGVLIPRPETELLVEEALDWLRAHPGRRRAADVGTGSCCIAVSLAAEIPDLHVTALDISPAALKVARRNILRHNLKERFSLLCSDLLSAASGPFDLVCANLPYIPTARLENLPVADHEPRQALDGGSDGLRLVERLLGQMASTLSPGGLALLEIESGQGQTGMDLSRRILPGFAARIIPDLAGFPRLLRIDRPVD